jgi:glycosyltransferase involved in cell wall biosynthesis
VPAGSVEALAGAMREALEAAPARLSEMGRAGAALVAEEHDAAREAGRLLELFGRATGVAAC